jgi:hypothetical protein
MIVGLTAILVPLTLALLLPYLRAGRDANVEGEWRYPPRMCKFMLYATPVLGAMMAFVYSTFPHGHPNGVELAVFLPIGIGLPGLLLLAYFYFDSYRVQFDEQTVTVKTAFRAKRIQLEPLAEICLVEQLGNRDLTLRDNSNRIMVRFDGSLVDFDELLFELERRTRSPNVTILKCGPLVGWTEKENLSHSVWRSSKGPAEAQKAGRRQLLILIAGAVLFVTFLTVIYFVS